MSTTINIDGDNTANLTEDAVLTASGTLTVDGSSSAEFIDQSTTGQYGSFEISTSGNWQYILQNTFATVQELGEEDTVSERFLVSWNGQQYTEINLTISGKNDSATISSNTTSALEFPNYSTATGELLISDIDKDEESFIAQSNISGTLGNFSLSENGQWTYTARSDSLDSYDMSGSFTIDDSCQVQSIDGTYSTIKVQTTLSFTNEQTGTSNADQMIGNSEAETISAGGGNDLISGGGGNDLLLGGAGIDMSVYSGRYQDFTITPSGSTFIIQDNQNSQGQDILFGVERIQFEDTSLAFDVNGNAGNVAKILGAVFGASSLRNKDYVGIGLDCLDDGMTQDALMQLAIDFRLGPSATNEDLVTLLFQNIIGITPSAEDLAYWTDAIATDQYTQTSLAITAADLDLNTSQINLTGIAQTGLEYSPYGA